MITGSAWPDSSTHFFANAARSAGISWPGAGPECPYIMMWPLCGLRTCPKWTCLLAVSPVRIYPARGCAPKDWMLCWGTFPASGMMQNGKLFLQPRLGPRTLENGCSLLPTPTVTGTCKSLGYYLRRGQTYLNCTNVGSCVLSLELGFQGREEKPRGRFIVEPRFVEWMMGIPAGWTDPSN